MTDPRPILGPNDDAAKAAGEQFGAALAERLLAGLAKGLAEALAKRTMSSGPWLLHADGTITDPPTNEQDTAHD